MIACCFAAMGCTPWLPEGEILASVKGTEPLANKCRSLIDKANANGGHDKITAAVMAEFSGLGLPPADPTAVVEVKEFDERDFKGL